MSQTTVNANEQDTLDTEFPDLHIEVSPIVDRARATFAKDHNRPFMAKFDELFDDTQN